MESTGNNQRNEIRHHNTRRSTNFDDKHPHDNITHKMAPKEGTSTKTMTS